MTEATLQKAAQRSGLSEQNLDRFRQHLEALPVHRAARINPFDFAAAAGLTADQAIDLFLHGAKLGIFDLEWGMVCSLCGTITHTASSMDRMSEDKLHCCLCDMDVDSVLDDTIEVNFSYAQPDKTFDLHADYDAYQQYFTSSSYPYQKEWQDYRERHVVTTDRIDSGGTATLKLEPVDGAKYRLMSLDVHAGLELRGVKGAEASESVTLSDTGFSRDVIKLQPGEATLQIANRCDHAVMISLIRLDYDDVNKIIDLGPARFGPRLTGKHLLNNQVFRDTFAIDELAPDLKLKLRSLTLLFTDLKGSTALYDREGDLAAYRLVQDHFAALREAVRSHSGAMIKTMGDAVMAAFPTGSDGVAAAVSMMDAMQDIAGGRDDDVGLKVGLHTGPALAINAGTSLDYFGQTVNIAARVQGLADAGDICVTGALNAESRVPEILGKAGYIPQAERALLKGVSTAEQIFRYRAA